MIILTLFMASKIICVQLFFATNCWKKNFYSNALSLQVMLGHLCCCFWMQVTGIDPGWSAKEEIRFVHPSRDSNSMKSQSLNSCTKTPLLLVETL